MVSVLCLGLMIGQCSVGRCFWECLHVVEGTEALPSSIKETNGGFAMNRDLSIVNVNAPAGIGIESGEAYVCGSTACIKSSHIVHILKLMQK